ncbi:UDP-N-acetylglucosamine 1-carboxyvinyltransferase [Alkaliphilus serpentinus]|uniref:UDP-N-acetylglucosamine 1-carboxyvinyltransferase n=1 Tax=Alkaliphilus serpentinus TaxID=1482731 RepID=A0A833HRD9_9FIRM|nr:UDP-N-acetylglucosamine 1-carboxyvinyltransferase [Alkaliphilus serpentinus]KAB3533192.1 UDP-N-acetylglucosamine 1-carboxyvinyltransferase [Alkaliphilus serpentinus]
MSKFEVIGGNKIVGELEVQGAKNSVLPILAATVLNSGINIVHDIPMLSDVEIMIQILESVGCKVTREGNTVVVDSKNLNNYEIPEKLVREMRSSIIFLGAMLARCGRVKISYPGGWDNTWEKS